MVAIIPTFVCPFSPCSVSAARYNRTFVVILTVTLFVCIMMHMESHDASLTIEELAEQTQTSVRTVRYYIAERMLPGPGARGKGATYTQEHLLRLRLIRRLTERRAPLAEIRAVMARVTDDEVRALLAEENARAHTLEHARTQSLESAERSVSPRDYIAALLDQARAPQAPQTPPHAHGAKQAYPLAMRPPATPQSAPIQASAWRRVELAPGVELHIQQEAEERNRALIERLTQLSREAQDAQDES